MMKKYLVLLLAMLLLLTGCSKAGPGEMAMQETTDASFSQTETDLTQEPPVDQILVETPPTLEEESTPEELPESTPETGEKMETDATPPVATQPAVTPPAQTTQQTTKPTTQQTAKPTTKPTTSGRPTSSATCKDTGSDKIWVNPDGDKPDYYEETDPNRPELLEYLRTEGNPYFFWIQEETMRMYIGRTYGIPIYTGYDILMASQWESSDPTVATVNEYGFVTPLTAGKVTISVSCPNEDGTLSIRRCQVMVLEEPAYTFAYLEQRAKEEAKKIADYILHETDCKTDLERIAIAAAFINIYIEEGRSAERYQIVDGELTTYRIPGYNQPFGTLVSFYSTCAGDTRALGLVLEYLGYEWYHANENQESHQWCVVYDVDGQTAFADGSFFGIAGYGQRQEDGSNWMLYRNGSVVPYAS